MKKINLIDVIKSSDWYEVIDIPDFEHHSELEDFLCAAETALTKYQEILKSHLATLSIYNSINGSDWLCDFMDSENQMEFYQDSFEGVLNRAVTHLKHQIARFDDLVKRCHSDLMYWNEEDFYNKEVKAQYYSIISSGVR